MRLTDTRLIRAAPLLLLTAAVSFGGFSCGAGDSSSEEYGPLAVFDGGNGDDAHGGTGPVHITERCVTLTRENGDTLLLAWGSNDVEWDEEGAAIVFANPNAAEIGTVVISDGDVVEVGGSSLVGDPPVTPNVPWLATPDAGCVGELWGVSSVTPNATSPTPTAQSSDFGPLAVVDTFGGSLAGGGTGPISIDDSCVTLAGELLLIWHSSEVRWDATDQSIRFRGVGGAAPDEVVLRDGDIITIGGEGYDPDLAGHQNLPWLATPNTACPDEAWLVSGVEVQ